MALNKDVGREMLPSEVFYGNGDATVPLGSGPCVIAHICNDAGGWGKGFVLPLGRRYSEAEAAYRAWFRGETGPPFALGQVQFVEAAAGVWVANMLAQYGVGRRGAIPPIRYESLRGAIPPIRYESLRECLGRVREFALAQDVSVQMPRIGCGLAGGDWAVVSQIIEDELVRHGLPVWVLDLP